MRQQVSNALPRHSEGPLVYLILGEGLGNTDTFVAVGEAIERAFERYIYNNL